MQAPPGSDFISRGAWPENPNKPCCIRNDTFHGDIFTAYENLALEGAYAEIPGHDNTRSTNNETVIAGDRDAAAAPGRLMDVNEKRRNGTSGTGKKAGYSPKQTMLSNAGVCREPTARKSTVWIKTPCMQGVIFYALLMVLKPDFIIQKTIPHPEFVKTVKKNFSAKDTILLLCRSGQRSGIAARMLRDAGFNRVHNIADGFEGTRPRTRNGTPGGGTPNGWKNSGAPWAYELDPGRILSP